MVDSMVEAFSEYVPGPGSLLYNSLSSVWPKRCSFEPNGGFYAVTCFVVKAEKERAVMLCYERPFLAVMSLPAVCRGFLANKRAADFVGTAPLRLLRRTLYSLPGTDGHEA